MAAQKREPAKSYIGLLSDEIEELQAAGVRSAAMDRMMDYVRSLMATMFNRRSEARW